MFDQPVSLPMRAALASLLGSLFGIALILSTHASQAQTHETGATAGSADNAPSAAVLPRTGDTTLRSLRDGPEPVFGSATSGSRGLRFIGGAVVAGSGLRWQVARMPGLRSEGDIPRGRDVISLGLQVRF